MILYFAEAAAASPSLLDALGVNVKLLIEQTLAFIILVALLSKFVFPALIKVIDKREAAVEAAAKEAAEAREALENAEARASAVLKEARLEADALMQRSHEEAAQAVAAAETKAKQRAEQIVADARVQIDSDVKKARSLLKKDAVKLVAMATEQIIDEKVDSAKDQQLIVRALAREER